MNNKEELIIKLKNAVQIRNQNGGNLDWWSSLSMKCCEIVNEIINAGFYNDEINNILTEGMNN